MSKYWNNNEKGVALVEILAALVILSILFVGIMTIFPQMTLMNEKTEAKLDTMNLARQEMAAITAQTKWKDMPDPVTNEPVFLKESRMISVMTAPELGYTESASPGPAGTKRFHKTADYLYEVDIYLQCENLEMAGSELLHSGSCDQTAKDKLHKVHVKLFREPPTSTDGHQMISETFSFITYRTITETATVSEGG